MEPWTLRTTVASTTNKGACPISAALLLLLLPAGRGGEGKGRRGGCVGGASTIPLHLLELFPSGGSSMEMLTLLAWSWWLGQQVSGSGDVCLNKLEDWSPLLEADGYARSLAVDVERVLLLSPTGGGGEGSKRCCCSLFSAGWWLSLQLRATYAEALFASVILGRHGGPYCSSLMEVFQALRRSSASRECQVVRPRQSREGRHQRFIAGGEIPSIFLSDLSAAYVWKSLATGGGGALGLDCFLPFTSRVFFFL